MIKRDQTSPRFLELIKNTNKRPSLGIGIIVSINKTDNSVVKKFLPDITYQKVIAFKEAVALKFIPYGVTIKIDSKEFKVNNYRDFTTAIRLAKPRCNGKCNDQGDCDHLSDVCTCVKGNECH